MALVPGAEMLDAEWLEADGLGGFANGTASGIRTRRYHALLLAATLPPAGRMVLVNGFEAGVETEDGLTAISTQRYAPDVEWPDGVTRLENFTVDPWPTWTYAVAGGKVIHELFVPRGHAAVVLRWSWKNGCSNATLPRLQVRPFFSGRDFHALQKANPAFRFTPETVYAGRRWRSYDGVPAVIARSSGSYRHDPSWYRNFFYAADKERGEDFNEDLAAPGVYTFDFAAGDAVLIFSAEGLGAPLDTSLTPLAQANQLAEEEHARRSNFGTPHLRASDEYLVARGEGQTIIAGYPWFGDWGRDTFISMRGLCLATGRLAEARDILTAWAGAVSKGMLPNRFPDSGEAPEYNSVDASLWYVIVVHEFLAAAAGKPELLATKATLLNAVEEILSGYQVGTRFGIRSDKDGLLACGEPGVQLTWMDAKVGDWVVTPRIGKPVEVQALWLNALGLAARLDPRWNAAYDLGRVYFTQRFWNETRGCLYDVIDADHVPGKMDDSLRPNQLFAVGGGLPIALIEGDRAERIVALAEEKLWTPMGPRSLAPGEPHYSPTYEGDRLQRDGSYHQGTVWPWLAGPFVEAWVRVRGNTNAAKAEARTRFLVQLSRVDLAGLQHIPEIADAEPPHTARGCPFQAWSLGEFLRLQHQVLVKTQGN